MQYYMVMHSGEYAKKSGKYGIVDSSSGNGYDIAYDDGNTFPQNEFSVMKLIFEGTDKKEFADFQMSYFSWRLISEKLFLILQKYMTAGFANAYPTMVERQGHAPRLYYFLHFFRKLEVIDASRIPDPSQFPFVNSNRLVGIDIFSYNTFTPSVFVISERVKREFEQENITGCSFQLIS